MAGWLMVRLTVDQGVTYTAVLLGKGFNDPPLRLLPGLRWYHVAVWAAVAFVFGVVFYLALETP